MTNRRKVASAAPDLLASLVWADKSKDASMWLTQSTVCSEQQKIQQQQQQKIIRTNGTKSNSDYRSSSQNHAKTTEDLQEQKEEL